MERRYDDDDDDVYHQTYADHSMIVHYQEEMAEMFQREYRLIKSAREKKNIPRKYEYHLPRYTKMVQSDGDKRIRMLRTALEQLDHLGFRRSAHQRQFHEAFIAACLPQIYGKDLSRLLPKILKENNMEEIHSEIMVCCPRRWGKTMAVAIYAAAYLWTQPDAEVLIYSISKRTSTMLMQKVYNILSVLTGESLDVKVHNQEELEIVNAHGATSVCRCYPSSPKISAHDIDDIDILKNQKQTNKQKFLVCLFLLCACACVHSFFFYYCHCYYLYYIRLFLGMKDPGG